MQLRRVASATKEAAGCFTTALRFFSQASGESIPSSKSSRLVFTGVGVHEGFCADELFVGIFTV